MRMIIILNRVTILLMDRHLDSDYQFRLENNGRFQRLRPDELKMPIRDRKGPEILETFRCRAWPTTIHGNKKEPINWLKADLPLLTCHVKILIPVLSEEAC